MQRIYKRPGTPHWWVSFTVDGHRVRRSLRTDDEDSAKIIATDLYRRALISPITGQRESISLDHALARYWMEHARHLPSRNTIKHQAKALIRILKKPTLLLAIDDAAVSTFVARRRGEKARRGKSPKKNRGSVAMDRLVSNATVNHETGLLRTVMRRARDQWKCATAEVDWKKHKLQTADGNTRWLTPEQASRLIAVSPGHMRPPLVAALCTGLRAANVMRLDWSQVDLRGRAITVRVKSKRPGCKVLSIPIAPPLRNELVKLNPKEEGRVFLYRGRPIKTDTRRAFLTACKRAKIPGKFTWHDLRHTAASWMVQAGTPLAVVRDILGHSDISLTQRYAHTAPHQATTAVGAIGDALAGTPVAQSVFKKAAND